MSVSLLPQDAMEFVLLPLACQPPFPFAGWEKEKEQEQREERERKKRGEREGGREWGQDRGRRNGIWLSGDPEMLRSRLGQVGTLATNTWLK